MQEPYNTVESIKLPDGWKVVAMNLNVDENDSGLLEGFLVRGQDKISFSIQAGAATYTNQTMIDDVAGAFQGRIDQWRLDGKIAKGVNLFYE